MQRYHSDTARTAISVSTGGSDGGGGDDGTYGGLSLGIFGDGYFAVFQDPGTYDFAVPKSGRFRVRTIGGGGGCAASASNPAPGGTSSFGALISATGGTNAAAGIGVGGDYQATGGVGGARAAGAAGGGAGGGAAGSFRGAGGDGGDGGSSGRGGGGGGIGGAGADAGSTGGGGAGAMSSASGGMGGTGFAGERTSRFPTDILDGAGSSSGQAPDRGGRGAGGGGASGSGTTEVAWQNSTIRRYQWRPYLGGEGGELGGGGGGGAIRGKGGFGGGAGSPSSYAYTINDEPTQTTNNSATLPGCGGGWAHGVFDLAQGTSYPVTVGAGGANGGGAGLVVVEW